MLRLREEQITEIVSAYKDGTSSILLAKRFDVSPPAIRRWLKINKVEMRGTARPRLVAYEDLCADYLAGLTQAQVALKHKVSVPTVCHALKVHGVAIRPRLSGPAHPAWKGQKIDSSGYIRLSDGRLLHRVIAERLLDRPLKHWETGHHIDDNKQNNADVNIVVMPAREHSRFHTFLRHRGLLANRKTLEQFCRHEGLLYFRFTASDCARWTGTLMPTVPLLGGRLKKAPRKCHVKSCPTVGKTTQGLCSKHYQRKRARDRGYWISGGGRRHIFTGTRFLGSRKGVRRSG